MPGRFHNDMELLSAEDVERIYRVTDELGLHRDWVVVPLMCAAQGVDLLMPDGKLLLRPPAGGGFESWLAGLRERLLALDLGRVPRAWEPDPKRDLTGLWGPRFVGTRTYPDPRLASPSAGGPW